MYIAGHVEVVKAIYPYAAQRVSHWFTLWNPGFILGVGGYGVHSPPLELIPTLALAVGFPCLYMESPPPPWVHNHPLLKFVAGHLSWNVLLMFAKADKNSYPCCVYYVIIIESIRMTLEQKKILIEWPLYWDTSFEVIRDIFYCLACMFKIHPLCTVWISAVHMQS